jgi:UTP:GlnB (protein PII) uridylyltransferase
VIATDPFAGLVARSQRVDSLVRGAYEQVLKPRTAGIALAVLAVGGFGRQELFPYSDIDVLLLVSTIDIAKPEREAIAAFLQRLWDSGLRLSQSVRTVEECTTLHENNIELNTSILDYRLLCGDQVLYDSLHKKMPDFLNQRGALLAKHIGKHPAREISRHDLPSRAGYEGLTRRPARLPYGPLAVCLAARRQP